jgi:ketosteroid isomerase-like protein
MCVEVIATKKTPSKLGSRSSHARCHAVCGATEAIMVCKAKEIRVRKWRARPAPEIYDDAPICVVITNEEAGMTDHERLSELNEAYIRASLLSDTKWYDAYLADDFVCINPDATLLDKPQFLRMIAAGSDQATYHLDFVHIRVFGDVALIRAIGSWRTRAGVNGISHYTDVYVRRGEDWKVVSAQITRPPASSNQA